MKYEIKRDGKKVILTLEQLKATKANAEIIKACEWLERAQLDPIRPCGLTLESGVEINLCSEEAREAIKKAEEVLG